MQTPHIIICKARRQDIPRDIEPFWTSASLVLSEWKTYHVKSYRGLVPKPNSNLVSKPQYNIHVCKLFALIYPHLLGSELLSRAVHA